MQTEDSRQLVLDYLQAQGKGDIAKMNEILDDDVEWAPPASVLAPVSGRPQVQAKMAELGGAAFDLSTMQSEIHKILADGDTVAIIQTLRAKTTKGRDYENQYCWVYTCKGGKIVRMQEFADSLTFERVVNG